ncbi:MAG: hypothetical protein M3O71_11350 [Bacteroidota bacterium]|nr:hypothetical protein [Bacteroidota bacterium]
MTPKTFWTIFLKIFGLYLLWQTLVALPSFFSSLLFFSTGEDKLAIVKIVIAIAFIATFFIVILRYCLFKTDWIIEKLKLERGFNEEKLEVDIHRSSLLTIAVIVLGGLMLVDSLPSLIFNGFEYIQNDTTYSKMRDNRATPYLVSNFLKVVVGYFMVADSRLVVNFIERKRKKAN